MQTLDPREAGHLAEVLGQLPDLLYLCRRRRHVSLRTAAEEIGTSHSVLSRLERGQLPLGATLIQILQWLARE